MKQLKKWLAVVLAAALISLSLITPVSGAVTAYSEGGYSVKETLGHRFYQFVDKLIDLLVRFINTLIPGLNWTGRFPTSSNYTPVKTLMGKETFDYSVPANARWRMGFADASLLEGLDVTDGSYYLAGSLEAMEGRTPAEIVDDQTVNTYAVSDGVSGTVVHVVLDGYGIARGDVLEIRSRLADFAAENGIIAVNVSVLHQHSCIDTLGLSAPLVPALLKNPAGTLTEKEDMNALSGKNSAFMENLFTVVTRTVTEAVGDMTDGTLYYGSADATDLIRDKREPYTFDGEIHRLRFVPDDREKNEIWVCEAGMHCVTFGAAPDVLSSDFPYYMKQYIKEQTGADAVFIEGAELAITAEYGDMAYDDTTLSGKPAAMGKALGDKLLSISSETPLDPVLNIKLVEMQVDADNEILILAVREGLINSVVTKDGLSRYTIITELGYMELGNRIGVLLAPGEVAPEILWGGAASEEASWNGESWNYPPLADVCGAEKLICFGLCNDQIGYILCDNDVRSYLTENEEIVSSSTTAASALVKTFIELIDSVK